MKHITPEIKARVFALYWGQQIINAEGLSKLKRMDELNPLRDGDSLEVKPLSSITDEDAMECGYGTCTDPNNGNYSMSPASVLIDEIVASNRYYMLDIYDADHLRSKGYALPAFGYSVDELVEAGVFKLKEVNNE